MSESGARKTIPIQPSPLPAAPSPAPFWIDPDLSAKAEAAFAVLSALFRSGATVVVATSFGKDSSVVTSLALEAARRVTDAGYAIQPLYVFTSDTGAEQPLMSRYVERNQQWIRDDAGRHGFPVVVRTAYPLFSALWQIKYMGGRAIPVYVNANARTCTIDWKQGPIAGLMADVRKAVAARAKETGRRSEIVTLVGSRDEESQVRRASNKKHGLNDATPYNGLLAPIIAWSEDDVFTYLGSAGENRPFRSYKADFSDTITLYRDAQGECPAAAGVQIKSKACGARFGCWNCCAMEHDKSAINMLKAVDDDGRLKHEYMRPLHAIRNFLTAIAYDYSRRNWIGRAIEPTGYVPLQPETFNARTMEELMLMCLTADKREQARAERHRRMLARGELPDTPENRELADPQFELMPPQILIALDFIWARDHLFKPFHALYLWDQVYNKDAEFDPPELEPLPETAMPEKRFLHVGPFDTEGLSAMAQMFDEGFAGDETELSATGDQFEVAPDGLFMFFREIDRYLAIHDDPRSRPMTALRHYLNLGVVRVASLKTTYRMADRGLFLYEKGLRGDIDLDALLVRAISREAHETIARTGGHRTKDRLTLERREETRLKKRAAADPAARDALYQRLCQRGTLLEMDAAAAHAAGLKPALKIPGAARLPYLIRKKWTAAAERQSLEKYASANPAVLNVRYGQPEAAPPAPRKVDGSALLAERRRVPEGGDPQWAWVDGQRVAVRVLDGWVFARSDKARAAGYAKVDAAPVPVGESRLRWETDAADGRAYLLAPGGVKSRAERAGKAPVPLTARATPDAPATVLASETASLFECAAAGAGSAAPARRASARRSRAPQPPSCRQLDLFA